MLPREDAIAQIAPELRSWPESELHQTVTRQPEDGWLGYAAQDELNRRAGLGKSARSFSALSRVLEAASAEHR